MSLRSLIKSFYSKGAKVLTHVIYRMDIRGFDAIPDEGPAIIICNHVSYMDGLVLHTSCKRNIRFIIDAKIYNTPFVKYFMDIGGAIPILPNRKSVKNALDEVSNALKNGDIVCIFPEGSLTYTGNLSRFKFGIEWMVKRNPVPIYPVAIKGLWGSIFSRKYLGSKLRWVPRSLRRKVSVKCGDSIDPKNAKINFLQKSLMDLRDSIES